MASWLIRWSKEADNYFIDNGELVLALYLAIKSVANHNGLPDGPFTYGPRIEIWFEPENHIVLYERWESQQMIRVTMIKPKPDV